MPHLARSPTTAICLGVIIALAAVPAAALDKNPGSRNFTPPSSVPNYFSNESGPMLGGRADSRVVDPPNVSAVVPPPPQSQRAAVASPPPATTSARVSSPHTAKGHGRSHQATASHGRSSHRHVAAAHGKARTHVAVARSVRAASKSSKHRAS